ncbi:hypothetical protein PARMER_02414 [Parabacteroides merdae ATCC 43184]|nr:hypothetical protein PARMER_02414 [Parabacteroides merdae ATCC 43184]
MSSAYFLFLTRFIKHSVNNIKERFWYSEGKDSDIFIYAYYM